jgi:signal transduction histidine kinase
MRSIRRALGLRLSLAALVLLLVAAGFLHIGVRWLLTEQFDDTLRAKLVTFTTLTEQEGEDVVLGFVKESMPEFRSASEPEYVQLWLAGDPNGFVIYRSDSLGENSLPRLGGTEEQPDFRSVELPDGRKGRALGAEFEIHEYDPGSTGRGPVRLALTLARGTGPLDRALGLLLGGTIGVIGLVLGAGLLLGRAALRRGLRPLDELAQRLAALEDPVRAPAFDSRHLPAELVPLVECHNQMLERIRKAFERERRTAANIAHELRTPVAELMLAAEAAQRYRADPLETERRLGELREIGAQMSTLIATLLELARMESGQLPLELEPVELGELVSACWSPLSTVAEAKGQSFQAPAEPGPQVRTDRAALSILLSNLLRNAVEHGLPGDRIRCAVESNDAGWVLSVSNSSQGLVPSDIEKLCEPFWRASAARGDRAHAGLGLSLARRFAELLEVRLSFGLEHDVFLARLHFQAAS